MCPSLDSSRAFTLAERDGERGVLSTPGTVLNPPHTHTRGGKGWSLRPVPPAKACDDDVRFRIHFDFTRLVNWAESSRLPPLIMVPVFLRKLCMVSGEEEVRFRVKFEKFCDVKVKRSDVLYARVTDGVSVSDQDQDRFRQIRQ